MSSSLPTAPLPLTEELFDELLLGDARGGRRPARPVALEVERELTEEDLEALESKDSPALSAAQGTLASISFAHHQLARLVAQGLPNPEVSLLTGYSTAYISLLKGDPAFAELLAYYALQEEAKHVDVMERMRTLGLSTMDELQRRLAEEPDGWTKRELMELAELMLVKPRAAQAPSAGGSPAVAVAVTFVTPAQPPAEGKVIDHED